MQRPDQRKEVTGYGSAGAPSVDRYTVLAGPFGAVHPLVSRRDELVHRLHLRAKRRYT